MHQVVMPFDGSTVEVIKNEAGEPLVIVKSVCDAIGVAHWKQTERLKNNPTYKGSTYVVPSAGGSQETYCLPLCQLNLWLGSINPLRTKEPVRTNLISYQRECADVLYKHFMPRGEVDLQPFMDRFDRLESKLDNLAGISETVFGSDCKEIQDLIARASKKLNMTQVEYWGRVRQLCDVSSYKLQNRKIINFIKNDLGEGITLVRGEVVCTK